MVLSDWPAFRGFPDYLGGSIEFFDEVQSQSGLRFRYQLTALLTSAIAS